MSDRIEQIEEKVKAEGGFSEGDERFLWGIIARALLLLSLKYPSIKVDHPVFFN